LLVQVTADGRAGAVELKNSSNYARLDEAARRAVAGWRFVPARRGDEAVEASVIVPIVFRLDS
ncbi:MAG: energy transducer TonB, partial [Betaproteobacteria bacterium]|nr:energy transducer TonB [Betaproteobacteria bacterium]